MIESRSKELFIPTMDLNLLAIVRNLVANHRADATVESYLAKFKKYL